MSKNKEKVEHKNSSKEHARKRDFISDFKNTLKKKSKKSKGWSIAIKTAWVLGMMLWVALVLYAVQYLVGIFLVYVINVKESTLNSNAIQLLFSAIVYVLALAITIFVPWKIAKSKTTRDELGLRGMPTWTDILLAPIGFVVFMVVTSMLLMLLQRVMPGINWSEEQNVGFSNLISKSDFIMAFLCLVVIAPVAEEIIFRGWLYGKLRARIPAIPAIIAVSVLFGIVHGQWNVGVTVFVMSIAMCAMREITGTIWGGILVHIIKNGIAFYFLYVNPVMLQ